MQTPLIQNGGIVWGLGMCSSGSTWLFNVILKLAESLAPGLPREGRFAAGEPMSAIYGRRGGCWW